MDKDAITIQFEEILRCFENVRPHLNKIYQMVDYCQYQLTNVGERHVIAESCIMRYVDHN